MHMQAQHHTNRVHSSQFSRQKKQSIQSIQQTKQRHVPDIVADEEPPSRDAQATLPPDGPLLHEKPPEVEA
jgi:hypothetical protein